MIPCRFDRVRALIGTQVSNERIVEIFRALHLKVDEVTDTGCTVTAPLFRLDLEREADLIEEVARIDGSTKFREIPGHRQTLRLNPRRRLPAARNHAEQNHRDRLLRVSALQHREP